jgi:hypothetical protein
MSASDSIKKGLAFHRITKNSAVDLQSGANLDLIEFDAALAAIAVAPRSDFYRYGIYYPDPTETSGIGYFPLTPKNPWINPLGVNLIEGQGYPPAQVGRTPAQGKIYARVEDQLVGMTGSNAFKTWVDLIGYTTSAPKVIPVRADRRVTMAVRLPSQDNANGITNGALQWPMFGRRYCRVSIFTLGANVDLDVRIEGRKVSPGDDALSDWLYRGHARPGSQQAADNRFAFNYDAKESGPLDYMALDIFNASAASDPRAQENPGVLVEVTLEDE